MTRPALEGIIAAIPTPFRTDESLDLEALASNLERWNETLLSGYTVLGTTGEFVSLSAEEKKRVLETARRAIPPEKLFVAGTGAEGTRETVELTRFAADVGADYAIVVTPHYNRRFFTSHEIVEHYRRVADESPIGVVLYHIPVCTGLALSPETVARIAEHDNVAGIKDSSGDVLALQEMKRLCRSSFALLTGSVEALLLAFGLGAKGAILADACCAWGPTVALYDAFHRSELDQARRLQDRLTPFNQLLVGRHGIAGVKALLDRMGFHGGPPRRPLAPVAPEAIPELEGALAEVHRA